MCQCQLADAIAAGPAPSSGARRPPSQPPADRVCLPRNLIPEHYDVSITPHFGAWTFDGEVSITCNVAKPAEKIVLNSAEIKVTSASLRREHDGAVFELPCPSEKDYNEQHDTVTLSLTPSCGNLAQGQRVVIHLKYTGIINDRMVGFYRSTYTVPPSAPSESPKTKFMAVTQFEAVDCRRAIPCFDEPDLKATFCLTLVVDKQHTALSNTNLVDESTTLANGKRVVRFDKTPVMSTYLLAFAVGEFEYVEAYTQPCPALPNPVRCRVYTTEGLKERGRFALDVCTKTLVNFSELFGIPYKLPKCDQIAVPDFSAGAMENWGLITYRTVALLVDGENASLQSKKWIATVITHELAHQWFGNLVTFEYWDELWLNEGFATWVGTYGAAKLFPDWNLWTVFISEDQNRALSADAVRSSHPIQVPVPDAKSISQIFDGISYSKGASVIHMLTNWLGLDAFFEGIRMYLKKFQFANATTIDLWQCLAEASGKPVEQFMPLWTTRIGYPVLLVSEDEKASSSTHVKLHLEQHRFLRTGDMQAADDETVWMLPLYICQPSKSTPSTINLNAACASATTCKAPPPGFSVDRDQMMSTRSMDIEVAKGGHYLLNYGRSAFYRVAYPDQALASIAKAMVDGSVPLEDRMGIFDDAFALACGGYRSLTAYLSLAKSVLPKETEYTVFLEVSLALATVRTVWAEQGDRVNSQLNALRCQLFAPHARRIGFELRSTDQPLDRLLRPILISNAAQAGDPEILAECKQRFTRFAAGEADALLPDLYRAVMATVVMHGGKAELDAVMKIYEETDVIDLRYAALAALGFTRSVPLVQSVLEYSISAKVRAQDIHYVWIGLSANPTARRTMWDFLQKNWATLQARYDGTFNMLGTCVQLATSTFTRQDDFDAAKRFFKTVDTSTCSRKLAETYDQITANISWLNRDAKDVAAWLDNNVPITKQ